MVFAAGIASCSSDPENSVSADVNFEPDAAHSDTTSDSETADTRPEVSTDTAAGNDSATDTPPDTLPPFPEPSSGWPGLACDAHVESARNWGGEALYDSLCGSCHGDDATGSELGPDVQLAVVDYAVHVVRSGREEMDFTGRMPAFGADDISDEDLCAVIAWLRALEKPTEPAALYATFCANCHGEDASGGRTGIALAGHADLEHVQWHVRNGSFLFAPGAREQYMPRWESDELTDDDLFQLTLYINSL